MGIPVLLCEETSGTGESRTFRSSGNPILADGSCFTAAAAPLSHGGRLFLYVGHDEPSPDFGGFVMNDYAVMESTDPAGGDWILHQRNLVPAQVFSWATGAKAFAGHCLHGKDGRFYWYVPIEAEGNPPRMAIGAAVSETPTGPWKDAAGKPLVTWQDVFGNSESGQEVIDPHVFIDDDGQAYLYWGSWGKARVVRLDDSMTAAVGKIQEMDGLHAFFEAPWVFKRGNLYYMAYDWKQAGSEWTPSNYQACIAYATANNPLGPWTFRDVILSGTSATTVHPSIIEHAGTWWITYHTRDARGGGHFRRSVAIDEIRWDGDRLLRVKPTLANPPEFQPSRNLARDATPSASFTEQPPMTLAALHDGRVSSVRLPPDQWGNFRGKTNRVTSDWIRYDWRRPVRIGGVGIEFHQDPDWTRPPESWMLEYLDSDGAWKPVVGANYPIQPDLWHEIRFEPITTTALRATLHGQRNGELTHSLFVSEWEVHGVQAASLPEIEVDVVNGMPVFPESIDLEFPSVGKLSVPLVWRSMQQRKMPPGSYVGDARAIGQAGGFIRAKTRK